MVSTDSERVNILTTIPTNLIDVLESDEAN
ncbi:hypothetical protein Gohar_021166, partial [Gossypium harknessii]|nr:hypothetical protein [Gossypium harknessii]